MWRVLPLLLLPLAGCLEDEVPAPEPLWELVPFESSCDQVDCTPDQWHLRIGNRSMERLIGTPEGWLLLSEWNGPSNQISLVRPDATGTDLMANDGYLWSGPWHWDGTWLWGWYGNGTDRGIFSWNLDHSVHLMPSPCFGEVLGSGPDRVFLSIHECRLDGRLVEGVWSVAFDGTHAPVAAPIPIRGGGFLDGAMVEGKWGRFVAESGGFWLYKPPEVDFVERPSDLHYRALQRLDRGFAVMEHVPIHCHGFCFTGNVTVVTNALQVYATPSDVPWYSTDGDRVWATHTVWDQDPATGHPQNVTRTLYVFDGAWKAEMDVSFLHRNAVWAVGADHFAFVDFWDQEVVLGIEPV